MSTIDVIHDLEKQLHAAKEENTRLRDLQSVQQTLFTEMGKPLRLTEEDVARLKSLPPLITVPALTEDEIAQFRAILAQGGPYVIKTASIPYPPDAEEDTPLPCIVPGCVLPRFGYASNKLCSVHNSQWHQEHANGNVHFGHWVAKAAITKHDVFVELNKTLSQAEFYAQSVTLAKEAHDMHDSAKLLRGLMEFDAKHMHDKPVGSYPRSHVRSAIDVIQRNMKERMNQRARLKEITRMKLTEKGSLIGETRKYPSLCDYCDSVVAGEHKPGCPRAAAPGATTYGSPVNKPVDFKHDHKSLCADCNLYGVGDVHALWCSFHPSVAPPHR